MRMELEECSVKEIKNCELYLNIIKNNFGTIGGKFYKYFSAGEKHIVYCDGLYGVVFFYNNGTLKYNVFVLDENYNLDYAALDGYNISLKNGQLMTWRNNSVVYETIDFCKKETKKKTEFDSNIIYVQINSISGEELVIAYEWNDRGDYNRLYPYSISEPCTIAFLKNNNLQKYVLVKAEQGLLAYDIMNIKDYGLNNFFKKTTCSLNRGNEIKRYFKVKGQFKNGQSIILYPFSRQYTALEMKQLIENKGFNASVPDYLVRICNNNYKECEKLKEIVEKLKKLEDSVTLNLKNRR